MMDFLLLLILVVCALAAVAFKDLLSAVIILGAYSFIMALVWTSLNAVDVAFTEASVGAGITGILAIATLAKTRRMEEDDGNGKGFNPRKFSLFLVAICTAGVLIYGTADMPRFGDPFSPVNTHVAPRYIEHTYDESGVPNMVTAILANYRGYDTLGETTVIFTAGLVVILLLRKSSP